MSLCNLLTNFNPRTHVGCDKTWRFQRQQSRQFQSTHPRGVRPPIQRTPRAGRYFNPRTHVGCDILLFFFTGSVFLFQSTHPRGVRHIVELETEVNSKFQSTHPRGVRPQPSGRKFVVHNFNPRTHVGCDGQKVFFRFRHPISIHAPTWGATDWRLTKHYQSPYFNPRTHVGCDRGKRGRRPRRAISIHAPTWGATGIYLDFFCRVSPISIHAPTWGATETSTLKHNIMPNFNPRTHVGCDGSGRRLSGKNPNFNPRTHVGCDGGHHHGSALLRDFNPRTHVGCDVRRPMEKRGRAISIHAPTWGATFRCHKDKASPEIFQSTHPRGVRHSSLNMAATASDFNPRTHVGCDI